MAEVRAALNAALEQAEPGVPLCAHGDDAAACQLAHRTTNPSTTMVCTVAPTVLSGTVVRWYFPGDMAGRPEVEPAVSASRNGVRIGTFLHEVPADIMALANEAFEILRDNGPRELVQAMATHRQTNTFGGGLEPIDHGGDEDA